ncbi:LOW QUALITY PROTEIN: helicase with zinc finger domain 2 [Lingula anatina]|uniref:LOW QUALITY PROTEIN: helicase with zinc finger domain 2 n=1 Tax=Lingula anatina TaxID=7574 RepID=A0A1S3IRG4_LINAN|nr:LOW QUALITY PROTEIN: helicase with zinc finger domain 2 [Lingula anatina]|eukprot:XP_013400663.2 LOW QUALITY PROTEIN: helicase with zinc finger domain 2 [Lingula anatina]
MGISVEAWRLRIGCFTHSSSASSEDDPHRNSHRKRKCRTSNHDCVAKVLPVEQNEELPSALGTKRLKPASPRKSFAQQLCTYIPNLRGHLSAGLRLLLLIGLLLLVAGDVEANPGPSTTPGSEQNNGKDPAKEELQAQPISPEQPQAHDEEIAKYEEEVMVYLERGKEPFKRGEFDVAAEHLSRALEYVEKFHLQKGICITPHQLLVDVYFNRCFCYQMMGEGHYLMALKDLHKAIVYCSEITMIIDEFRVRGDILLSMISRQIRVDNDRNQVEEAKRVIDVMKKDGIIGFNKQEYMKALAIFGNTCKLANLLRNWRDKDADVILADMQVRFAETWFELITVSGLDHQRVFRTISKKCQECLDLTEGVYQSELVNKIRMKAHFYRAQCFYKSKMYKEAIDTALQLARKVRDLENLKEMDMLELRKLCTEEMEAISGSQTAVNEEWLEGTNIAEGIRAKRHQEKILKHYQESKTLKVKKIKYKQVPRKPEAGRQELKAASAPAPVKAKEGNSPQRTDETEMISKLDKLTDTSIPDDRKKSNAPLEYKLTTRGSGISSRDSEQMVGIKAKFPLQDVRIQLACSSCCVESKNSGDAYWYDWQAHESCSEDRLLLQRNGEKLWLWIKTPLYSTLTDISTLCKTHLHGKSSSFPVEKCKYPHSKEEQILWKKEQRHEFKILNFIDELRYAYHPKPKTPQELIQKYGGKLVFVCRKCFYMKPTVISWKVKDKDCCENGHRWKVEGFLLVHESIVGTGRNRIPIRERPRGYAESDMYQRCAKGICTDGDCPKAHFDIERDVWHLETINNWTRKDFIRNLKKLNSHDKKTPTMINTLGTVIENTEVLSARIQHLDSVSSASTLTVSSEVKCQTRVQYACRKCYIKNPNRIVGPSVDFMICDKQLHPWNPDTFLCVALQEDGKYCEIRELPDVKRDQFDLCVNIKSSNRCFRGKECTYAHSPMEKLLWEWMQKNGVLSLEELVIASERSQSSPAPKQDGDDVTEHRIPGTRFCFPKFYCKYCYKECNSKIQLERHFSSQKHKSVLSQLNRSDQPWNCREPPPNLIDFKLCKRHCEDGETCLYSGVEDHLNLCPFAHSEEELGEWNQRAAQKDALRNLMKETKVYPYLNQVYEDYLAVKDTEKEKNLIVYDMKGIDITPNPQTEDGKQLLHKQFQDKIKNDKGYTFTVKVDTSKVDLTLERASLLLFKHRDHFGIETDGGDTVQLIAGDSVCSNVDNNTYELRVLFKTFIFGTFEQILLLDFGQRPFLGVSLKVDVGTEQVLRKLFKVRKLKQMPRDHVISDYIPCASNPTPLQEVVGKYLENTWDSSYNLTSLFDKKELNRHNYVGVMHQLLIEEQKEQAILVQGCRIKAGTEVMTHLPPSLHHIRTDKHLFAKITMDENLLQFGRETVELLLTSVSRGYIQLVTSPSSEFYEVEVLNYQDFIDRGRTRDSIYLALSDQCCQDLPLIPDTCTYLTVQFKLDVTNFQLMHLALERLDANLDVFFPDYTLDQPMRDCLPGELKKIHGLEEKKLDILKNILSEPVGDLQIPPTIILGAFGTGKTYILKEAVALLMKDTSKRVLICCKFDSAADLYVSFIEHKLMEHSKQASKRDHPLRIYGIEKEKGYKDVKYSVCTRPSQKQLDRHRIIITTLSASMLLKFGPSKAPVFTHIFIDEAGQALEPELVMPLSLADPKTVVVLAGDNRQLLPKIYSRVAKDQHFEMSLLQRLFHLNLKQMKEKAPEAAATAKSGNQHVFHLTINYRSTPEISQFLGQTFYQGHLHCAAEIGSDKGVPPLSFWVTRGEEKRSGASYYNIPEAKEVMMRVQYLIENGKIKPSNMAVVTPYEGQMLVMSEMLEEKGLGAVKTEIIENIQGLEFDAIILSTVRTCSGETSSGALGFLENSRLLNTAMGRARRHILVVGDPFTLCSIGSCRTIWKHYIDECRVKSSLYPDIGCEIVEEILGKDYQRLGGTENGKETVEHHETAKSICTDTTARDSGYSSVTGSGDSECTSEIDSDKDDELSDEEIFKNLEKQWKDDEQFVSSKEISYIQDEIHFERDGYLEDEHSTNTLHDMKLDSWLYQTHRYARGADDEEMNEGEAEDEDDVRDLNEHFYDFFVKGIDQKENYYEHLSKIELMDMLKREPSKFKICTLYIESAQKGFAVPIERNEPVPRINLYGRSNCGMAFDKTEVVVRLNNPPTSDKINLDTDFHGKVIGTWSQVKVRKFTKFVCTVDEFRIDLMKPLNKTVPKIHVMNPTGTDNRIAVYSSDKDGRLNVKRWEPVDLRLRDSKVFVVRCLKWSVFQYPLGYVVKVLPAGTDFTNAQEILKIQYQLSQKFPVDVEKKKRALMRGLSKRSQKVPEDEEPKTSHLPDDFFTNREDCRQLHCFTIDPKDSEDLDDALSVDFCEDDTVRVGVHIADVSAFVEPGDPIDQEAALRSRTFYPAEMPDSDERSHPEKPYHMLPTELSTNFCSLLEGKDRVAISVFFKFDKNGNITIGSNIDDLPGTPKIKRTVIRSKRQLSYKDSEDILRDSEKEMGSYLTDSLIFLHKAAEHLRHNRLKEAAKFVHADGKESPMSERIIGEFMILTNATIAKILTKTFRYVPLRVHFAPDKETLADWQNQYGAIAELTSYLSHYVKEPQTSPEFITVRQQTWQKMISLAESTEGLSELKNCLASEEDYPMQFCAMAAWFDVQRPARYVISDPNDSDADYSHFDLNVPIYTQVSSPIRKYMDLIVQRLLCDMLDGKTKPTEPSYNNFESMQQICLLYNENSLREKMFSKDCKILKISLELQKNGQALYSPVVTKIEESSLALNNPAMSYLPRKYSTISYRTLGLMDVPVRGQYNDIRFKWSKRLYNKEYETAKSTFLPSKMERDFKLYPFQSEVLVPIDCWIKLQNTSFWFSEKLKGTLHSIQEYNYRKQATYPSYVSGDMSILEQTSKKGSHGKPLILPECKLALHLTTGNVLETLMSSCVEMGKLRPFVSLLGITPHFKICLSHREDPVKMFSDPLAARPLMDKYVGIEHYQNVILPVLAIESAACAVANDDAVTIQNVTIVWEEKETENKTVYYGRFTLGDLFCEEPNIEFFHEETDSNLEEDNEVIVDCGQYGDYICVIYTRMNKSEETKHSSFPCTSIAKCDPIWCGHGLLITVGKNKRVLFRLLGENIPGAILEQSDSEDGDFKCCVEIIQKTLPNRYMKSSIHFPPWLDMCILSSL